MLIAACATRWPKDEVVKALGRLTLVCRGPKPIAALKEVGLAPALGVPEPKPMPGRAFQLVFGGAVDVQGLLLRWTSATKRWAAGNRNDREVTRRAVRGDRGTCRSRIWGGHRLAVVQGPPPDRTRAGRFRIRSELASRFAAGQFSAASNALAISSSCRCCGKCR
jgi:hypothetical protein